MSNKETQNTEQKEEKVVTKYDLKVQKRQQQKEKEKKEQRVATITGIVVVAALVCLVASFPIRTYMATHESFVKVGGQNVNKVEFDYNYNLAKNNYITQYGSYLSYFGLDTSSDLSTQMYSDTLTWQDFFEQMAVDTISRNVALTKQAEAEGFTYDTSEDYKNFEDSVKSQATEAGTTVKEYLQQLYGSYATMGRLSEYVKNAIFVNAYYEKLAEDKAPTDEEIQNYYTENVDSYDSVDYYVKSFDAVLPTEPTELADPVEPTATPDAAGTTTDTTATDTEAAYEPSEAEVAAAMADAKELADAAEANIEKEGELQEGVTRAAASTVISSWLFDASRKEGDTTVIEDTTGNRYYVLSFVKRYLDETPSVDVRVLMTQDEDGEALLEEWKSGEATEESFGELCAKYSDDTTTAAAGGLYEAITKSGMDESLSGWLFDTARVSGDTTSISIEGDYTYVMYYVGTNDPEWKLSINNTLVNETMAAYLEEIMADIKVEDNKGNLNYLAVEASEAAAATAETTTEASTDATAEASAEATSAETTSAETTTSQSSAN